MIYRSPANIWSWTNDASGPPPVVATNGYGGWQTAAFSASSMVVLFFVRLRSFHVS